jgi:hypothetical protein
MGGPSAPRPVAESIAGSRVIDELRPADSGSFLDWQAR